MQQRECGYGQPGARRAGKRLVQSILSLTLPSLLLVGSPLQATEGNDRQDQQTQLQNVTEVAVTAVCGGFVALRNAGATFSPIEQDLFSRCGEMVHSARELDGEAFNPNLSLGLTAEQLAGAWQNLATEEAASQGNFSTEFSDGQLRNVGRRLTALRHGARGLSIADLYLNTGEHALRVADLGVPEEVGVRGGAASADDQGSSERWGLFLNGIFGFGDRDTTDREAGFDFDSTGVTLGVDYRFSQGFVGGIAIGYNEFEAEFEKTPSGTVTGGSMDAEGTSFAIYLTSYTDKMYFDVLAMYGDDDYESQRNIIYPTVTRTATADASGDRGGLTATLGYEGGSGAWTWGPYLRGSLLQIDVDPYVEQNAGGLVLEVDAQSIDSLLGVLGLQFARASSTSWGVIVPQALLEWNHEFDNDSRTILARYFFDPNKADHPLIAMTDEPDRDYFPILLGFSAVFRGGNQVFLNYETVFDLDHVEEHIFTAGIRFSL